MSVHEPIKPQISRVYDYVLGGTQNFEEDRKVAAAMMDVIPSYPTWARLNRRFLTLVAKKWLAEGQTAVLDLGSGLPTQGHFHTIMPDASILYSDFDTFCVSHGGELISHLPNTRYVHGDLRNPQPLLESASAFFQDRRKIAIGFIGVPYFLTEDVITQTARLFHEWASPGAVMALSFLSLEDTEEGRAFDLGLQESMKPMNLRIYFRPTEKMAELMKPWRMVDSKRLEIWLDDPEEVTKDNSFNNALSMHGMLLVHD